MEELYSLVKALNHPTRVTLLKHIAGSDGAISPKTLAIELDDSLSNIGYHVRVLEKCRAVKLVGTKPVRGSMQHFYKFSVTERWALVMLGIDANDGAVGDAEDEATTG